MKIPALYLLVLGICLTPTPQVSAQNTAALDEAFSLFWRVENPEEAAAATAAIVATGAGFEAVWERLKAGRPYTREVKTGRVDLTFKTTDGARHFTRALVPESYDPEKRYAVRFYLHGGVNRPAWRKGGEWWRNYARFEHDDRISVFPSSWESSMWWQRRQAENLPGVLDLLKRAYNLDENDVHLTGISDGGTGVYFFAFRDPTPWASFLPFIGHPGVLANRRMGADGQMYVRNLANRPFFVVNSGQDRLYPSAIVLPFLDLFHWAGSEIQFRHQPEAGHDTSWWPTEAEIIDSFIGSHRRTPLPDRLAWETESTERYERIHWLLITELGSVAGESTLDDFNHLIPPPNLGLDPDLKSDRGVRVEKAHPGGVAGGAGVKKGDLIVELGGVATPTTEALARVLAERGGHGTTLAGVVERRGERLELIFKTPAPPNVKELPALFPRNNPSGRIELEREGNTVRVKTQGVRRYKLLLSPDQFDLERPITVITNGRESWSGRVSPSVETLLDWAARDNDRTMLFAAELEIDLG